LWCIRSCFQWYKNYENSPRDARFIVENKVASFFPDMVYFSLLHETTPAWCVLCREVFVKTDGSLYREGDIMYCLKLAETLEIIASDNGVWDMYNGSLAQRIVEDLQDIGKLNKTL